MRENVLDAETSDELRVYAVWLNQRVTDERGEIDAVDSWTTRA